VFETIALDHSATKANKMILRSFLKNYGYCERKLHNVILKTLYFSCQQQLSHVHL